MNATMTAETAAEAMVTATERVEREALAEAADTAYSAYAAIVEALGEQDEIDRARARFTAARQAYFAAA